MQLWFLQGQTFLTTTLKCLALCLNIVLCVSRPCCPPGAGLIQCWMTLTWWSTVTCPASPTERRRDTSSARYDACKHEKIYTHALDYIEIKSTLLSFSRVFILSSLQLLDMLKFYTGFEINDQTGNALTQKEMTNLHYDRITSLQVKMIETDVQWCISAYMYGLFCYPTIWLNIIYPLVKCPCLNNNITALTH